MDKKVIVLGAGIAGLASSIELLHKGYKVTLIEKNNSVGGLCSGYFVNGHYIDACLHWLMGTKEDGMLYKLWSEIGAFSPNQEFIKLPTLGSFIYKGDTVTFYRDIEKTREELIKLSPIDEKAINLFIDSIKEMDLLMSKVQGYKSLLNKKGKKRIKNYSHIIRCMKYSKDQYSKRFKHPAIQFAIKHCQTGYNNMFFFLDLYAIFISGNADIPVGGALYMVNRIKDKFLSLGGELILNEEVKQITTNNGLVTAVVTDKSVYQGDYYISAIDPKYTFQNLLDNKYKNRQLNFIDKNIKNQTISSAYCLYFVIDDDVRSIDVPTGIQIKPIKVGANKTNFMLIRPYHFDKCFIKDNKTVVSIFIDQNQDDYFHFKSLKSTQYQKEINCINSELLQAFKDKYPQFAGKIEILSSFSPIDLNHQTNTSYGSIQSYSFTNKGIFYSISGRVPKLSNLYLCSQWNRAIGGTPTALLSATSVAKKF